jgi:hypothetical protein
VLSSATMTQDGHCVCGLFVRPVLVLGPVSLKTGSILSFLIERQSSCHYVQKNISSNNKYCETFSPEVMDTHCSREGIFVYNNICAPYLKSVD